MEKLFSYRIYYFLFALAGLFLFCGAHYAYAYMAPIDCAGPYLLGQKYDASPPPTPKNGQFACAIGTATGDTPVPSIPSGNFYRCEETMANQLYCRHYINPTTDYYTCTYYGTGAHVGSDFFQRIIFDNCTYSVIPPTISFTAPSSINLGQSATLSWNVTNAATCTATGGWSGAKALPSGSETVTPTTTTTYTLSCTGSTTLSQSRTVTVNIPDTTPPTSPTNLAAFAVATSQINLTWTASTDTGGSGLAGYRIERCMGVGCASFAEIATSPIASYSNIGLAPSTSYSYRARAYDGAGNTSGYSNIDSDTTPAPADTTPPSAPSLSGVVFSPTQIDLSWTASTDNVGVTGYRVYRNTTLIYTAGSATTIYSDMGLIPSTSYSYYVSAYDSAGNATQSNTVTIATPAIPDTTPPVFIFNSPGSTLLAGTTSATLGGTTNENATCRYNENTDTTFDLMTPFSTTGTTSHTKLIPQLPLQLTDGTVYYYYVKCRDTAPIPNTNPVGIPYMFQVDSPLPDTTPPIISNGSPSGVLAAGTTSVTMSVVTDDDAYCRYNQDSDTTFDLMTNNFTSSDLKNHTVPLIGLTNGSSYLYYVRCQNTPGGYANTSGYPISFVIAFPANMNPMALIVITPSTSGTAPFAISANGSGSYDSDGSIAQYTWSWGDGSPNATGVGSSHTYATAGTYALSLKVVDNQGGSNTAYETIAVSAATVLPPPSSVNVCTAECTHTSDCIALYGSSSICGPSKFCTAQGGGEGPFRSDFYLSRTDGSMSQQSPATFPAGTASVIMSMKTDVNAECQYSTVSNTLYDASAMKTFTSTGTLDHSVTLTGLASMTASAHTYYVRCRDLESGIVNDTDQAISFITGAPIIVSGPDPYMCLINADFVRDNIPYVFDICMPKP